MSNRPAFTLAQLAACAAREVMMRRRVYPRWVQHGRMSQEKADAEIAMMQAIADMLDQQAVSERLL